MKRNFTEMLCIRGAGAFKAGVCYPRIKESGNIVFADDRLVSSYYADLVLSEGGDVYETALVVRGSQNHARFVRVKICKRKSG